MLTAVFHLSFPVFTANHSFLSEAISSSNESFAIISHSDFVDSGLTWSLERLRDWHNENDTITAYIKDANMILNDPTYFVNGPWGDGNTSNPYWRSEEDAITDVDLFNDTQAIIRNYIRYAHHELNVGYVLLVGDEDRIPSRKLTADGYGAPACGATTVYYENVPTNLYYACLDGTFNDDEDLNNGLDGVTGWGENATHNSAHNIDEVDWGYEVAVGRITPKNHAELSNIVRKTITYMEYSGDEDFLFKIALAGHYAGFGGIADWGVNYAKQIGNTACSDWNHLTYGFDPSIYDLTYVDPNPNRPPEHVDYTDENVKNIFDGGVHMWYQCGHGNPSQWNAAGFGDSWDIYDVLTLENDAYPLVYGSLPCNSGRWDDTDCLSEAFINDHNGAFASIMNSRYGWGSIDDLHSTSHYIGREFFDAYFKERLNRLGDMLFDAFKDSNWLRNNGDGTIRWSCFDQNLLGSPAVKMKFSPSPQQGQGYDAAITDVDPQKTILCRGYPLTIIVSAENQGNTSAVFTITTFADALEIGTMNIYLDAAESGTLIFIWNSTSISLGNRTISAHAWPIPGEEDTSDNTLYADEDVCLTLPGDVNGDFIVNMLDVVRITSIYSSKKGDYQYDPNMDINNDEQINILDLVICTTHYAET